MEQKDPILQNELQSEYSAMIDDVLHTLDGTYGIQNSNIADTMYNPPSVSSVSSTSSSSPTFTNLSQPNIPNLERVRIKIVEEPAPKGLRFRYICEGRSAGSIPGIHSTPENKTFPTIEIEGYEGTVKIVVSCVTKDVPHRPHPHNLVGKENCEHGVCTMRLNGPPMRAVFSNLGIQCVKKKDIRAALEERERKRIDPFKTKFAHKDKPSEIDLNVVRLCFQAFIPIPGPQKYYKIPPVVSEPIYDKKSINDLVICRLCSCSAKVTGGAEIFLLCEKVPKDDIKIRFYEEKNNELYWEDYAEFQHTDVHKQTAIAFKTPRYINPDINRKVQVYIQLYRPSDGEKSEPLPFEFYPDPGMRTFPRIQRKLKRKQDMEIFQQILSLDSETTATKYSVPSTVDAAENDNENDDTVTSDSTASKPLSSDTLNENEEVQKRQTESFEDVDDDDDTGNYNYIDRNDGDMEIELPVPQITFPTMDDSTQTSTPIEEILRDRALEEEPRQLTTVDKIKEWMNSNEFERTDSLIVENGDNMSLGGSDADGRKPLTEFNTNDKDTNMTIALDDERMNTELIEQDIELDDHCSLELLAKRNKTLEDHPVSIKDNSLIVNECGTNLSEIVDNYNCSASAQVSVEIDETFDETATYTSLQIALKNPIKIPIDHRNNEEYKKENKLVVLTNPPAPKIRVNAAQTPQTPSSPPLPLPPRTPSPIVDQILPPLPPKRKLSQDPWAGTNTDSSPCHTAGSSRNGSISSRPPSQLIIMRTPDQSPTKRSVTSTPSPKKKQSFFSRLFSRRKSKAEAPASGDDSNSKFTTPNQSREPSIGNFSFNDNKRSSIRSVKSLQPNSLGLEPKSCEKSGKAVGRSASSVSGKRPAYRIADVIHIPLKGDSSEDLSKDRCYSSSCTLRYDGGLLDRKTLSALHLADIPISDGNMELIAIADRQSIKNLCEGAYGVVLDPSVDLSEAEHFALYTTTFTPHDGNSENSFHSNQPILTPEEVALRLAAANDNIKRKRLRTGGHPINMFQEIQQFDQNQMQYNNVNSTNMDFWNVQAPTPSTSSTAPTVAEIKPEPYLSPIYYGGSYRNTYQASPSPQPLSPMMNRNINTPSPNGLMRNSSAESQTQMSFAYNQSQMNITESQYQNVSNNFHMNPNNPFRESSHNPNHNISNSNMLSPPQTQFASFNPSFNRTSGGSITPIYANDNLNNDTNNPNNQILNAPELPAMKLAAHTTHLPTLQGSSETNGMLNQFQTPNTATTPANNNNNNTTQFQALNMPNNFIHGQNIQGTATNINVMLNQFQDTNVSTVSAEGFLNNLLLIDNNDFVDVNSDELRNLSNLSIST